MRSLLIISQLLFSILAFCQPATEIWLFDIDKAGKVTNPINVSDNIGYDNQPSFTRGGNQLLYASTRNGQTDIISYDIKSGKKEWLTSTPGSEYSPLHVPGTFTFSTILLEQDGRQLLWNYSLNGGKGEIMVPYIKIGYHTWLDDKTMYAFVLGPDPTFQIIDRATQRAEIIQEKIGRSLSVYEGEIYFIDTSQDAPTLSKYDPANKSIQGLITTPPNSLDFAISSQGSVYMAQEDNILIYHINNSSSWQKLTDLTDFGLSGLSRLAISPDNKKIAIVATE
jgi:hypothetical protein